MRPVSVLCRLCRQVVLLMAWLGYSRLAPLVDWLWRRLCLFWRGISARLRPIVGPAFAGIGWRKDPGRRRHEPEGSGEGKPCGVEVVGSDGEGQHEERAALPCDEGGDEFEGGGCRVEPRCEEEEEEEEEGGGGDDDNDDELDSEVYRVETSDELYCGYDSTWETEERQGGPVKRTWRPAASRRHYKFSRFENAARDMHNYRHDYPNQLRLQHWNRPASDDKPNLMFYLGLRPSQPDGVYIHNFHNMWSGEYDALEYVHTYIQWLFPLQEPGVNNEASPLTKEEIKGFLENSTAKENLLKSYKLMLDFYGIELCDEKTGEVQRASNWRDRFNNLNTHTHNNLRITRILKCQGTLGYPQYQAPLVRFFLEETLVHGELPNVKDSVLNYFVFAVLDKRQRRRLIKFAYLNYDRKDEFVWCPKKIQRMWSGLPDDA
ncbi:opioid growth factor receptor-like [Chelmon rostratus]|uniref:opioid growth factor receptor-like n=1 Tax=Chelmon rostratus TaxID=109905 RepID=UPI001BE7A337|nr:opioid growth factor receptor-like [Chelmon rostratus]